MVHSNQVDQIYVFLVQLYVEKLLHIKVVATVFVKNNQEYPVNKCNYYVEEKNLYKHL